MCKLYPYHYFFLVGKFGEIVNCTEVFLPLEKFHLIFGKVIPGIILLRPFQALNIVTHEEDATDVITGLKQKTFYGRPNWNLEFGQIANQNTG